MEVDVVLEGHMAYAAQPGSDRGKQSDNPTVAHFITDARPFYSRSESCMIKKDWGTISD